MKRTKQRVIHILQAVHCTSGSMPSASFAGTPYVRLNSSLLSSWWSTALDLKGKFSLDEPHACDRYNQEHEAVTACKGREALAAWKASLEVINEIRFVKFASEKIDLTPKTKQIAVDISPSLTCRVMAWLAGRSVDQTHL